MIGCILLSKILLIVLLKLQLANYLLFLSKKLETWLNLQFTVTALDRINYFRCVPQHD